MGDLARVVGKKTALFTNPAGRVDRQLIGISKRALVALVWLMRWLARARAEIAACALAGYHSRVIGMDRSMIQSPP